MHDPVGAEYQLTKPLTEYGGKESGNDCQMYRRDPSETLLSHDAATEAEPAEIIEYEDGLVSPAVSLPEIECHCKQGPCEMNRCKEE